VHREARRCSWSRPWPPESPRPTPRRRRRRRRRPPLVERGDAGDHRRDRRGDGPRDGPKLALPDAPPPFHISYKITEVEVNDAVASLGFITNAKAPLRQHRVPGPGEVRRLDNGNFVIPREEGLDGSAGTNLPLEATPRIARRAAWLVTDQAYKEALVQLRAKLDARTAGGVGATPPPVWSDVKPLVSEDAVLVRRSRPRTTIARAPRSCRRCSATSRTSATRGWRSRRTSSAAGT
jgi:hypothetical protein